MGELYLFNWFQQPCWLKVLQKGTSFLAPDLSSLCNIFFLIHQILTMSGRHKFF